MSKLEQQAMERIQLLAKKFSGVVPYRQEYRFHPVRRWRFDFAWPDKLVAIEINGGSWKGYHKKDSEEKGGRHNHPVSLENDYQKYNEAALLGWKVFLLTGKMLKGGELERVLLQALL